MGAHRRATDLYAVGSVDPDHDAVMRIGGKAPGGGPILPVGISAMFEYGFAPPPSACASPASETLPVSSRLHHAC
jgi:hypothetical protein